MGQGYLSSSLSSALNMPVPYEYGALGKSAILGSKVGICLFVAPWFGQLHNLSELRCLYLKVDKIARCRAVHL